MIYTARDLPAWVRFRRKPEPRPVYTVLTEAEHRLQQIMVPWAVRTAEKLRRQNALMDYYMSQRTRPVRVQIPPGYRLVPE